NINIIQLQVTHTCIIKGLIGILISLDNILGVFLDIRINIFIADVNIEKLIRAWNGLLSDSATINEVIKFDKFFNVWMIKVKRNFPRVSNVIPFSFYIAFK